MKTLPNRCEQSEVMFSLIHFLESFDAQEQLSVFIALVPQLIVVASNWTRILHHRILNDEAVCSLYREMLHSLNAQNPHFIRQLLEESANYRLSDQNSLIEVAGLAQ